MIRGQQGMRWLDSIMHSMDMNLMKLQEIMEDKRAWHASMQSMKVQSVGHNLAAE